MTADKFAPKPGKKIKLKDYDPDFHGDKEKESTIAETIDLQKELCDLQEKLYAQASQSLLIVLQAMDTGGKDGAIKKVFEGINPQGVRVTAFKAPTLNELAQDFLWRVHPHVPPKGYIGIFNRSHYEDVLVVRVNNLVPKKVLEKRYDHINNFEQLLADNGTRILKFYLHISKDEQKERLQSRLDNPDKNWKFSTGDLPVRQQWDAYMDAYEVALTRCNTDDAPWYIVPANRKWYRDWFVTRTIVETLEAMKPEFPPPEEGLDKVVIPD
ncbi:MAG: PPK2 family polyphosphate kinase [Chloroflexota bacterium]